MLEVHTDIGKVILNDLPSDCPNCHHSIVPKPLFGHYNKIDELLEVLVFCPAINCNKAFIAKYYFSTSNSCDFNGETSRGTILGKKFSEIITNISIEFINIFNQSFAAEQQNLKEICGVGYRKALEFLIKDYAILINPDKQDKIEKKLLGQCINDYVTDTRVKSVAKRAAWLGNDETHYIRKWEGKNLTDLKKLIDLTVHWIEMEALTASFEEDMPE